jgi:hypothetical protein
MAGFVAGLGTSSSAALTRGADWVVCGMPVLTAFGAALAVHHREHPMRKRSFSRS